MAAFAEHRSGVAANQGVLFDAPAERRRVLPMVGEQADIAYFAAPARSVLNSSSATGMGFWSVNPYVGCAFGCAYCYARFAHKYAVERLASDATDDTTARAFGELPPWLAFERRILVKREAGALLARELRRPARIAALRNEGIVIGTATDPYQPAERRFRVTRSVLSALAEHRDLSVTVITKSPLITRDIDLLQRIAERSSVTVHMSLISVDRDLARRLEPRAPTPEARLRAMARLRDHGIEVGVNVMPVLPGITDGSRALDALVAAVAKARVSYLGACALRLQSSARQRYLPFIEAEFPELAARYRAAYGRSPHASQEYRDRLRERFVMLCERHGVRFGRYYDTEEDIARDDAIEGDSARDATSPLAQLALAL